MLTLREFIFLRHGETDWNAQGRSQGRTDVPLNAAGVTQAEAAARLLTGRGIGRIVCSPLSRALRTAEIVGAALALGLQTDAGLQEVSFGAKEGQKVGPWYNEWIAGTSTPEGGESFAALRARVVPAVNRALDGPGLVLIVAHGAMFRALRAAMGLSPLMPTQTAVPMRCRPGVPWEVSKEAKDANPAIADL